MKHWFRMTGICLGSLILFLGVVVSCATDKPKEPVNPQPLASPIIEENEEKDDTPDVIKIAINFVEFEGRTQTLLVEKAYVKRQDYLAYYIGFPQKNRKQVREAVVKVHKMDGYPEWEEY